MLLGPQTWFLNFFFFCKFDFFFLSTSTRMRKIIDFKNNARKVKRVQKTFENLNSFETMMKMLKTMQICIFLDFRCFSLFLNFFENFIK